MEKIFRGWGDRKAQINQIFGVNWESNISGWKRIRASLNKDVSLSIRSGRIPQMCCYDICVLNLEEDWSAWKLLILLFSSYSIRSRWNCLRQFDHHELLMAVCLLPQLLARDVGHSCVKRHISSYNGEMWLTAEWGISQASRNCHVESAISTYGSRKRQPCFSGYMTNDRSLVDSANIIWNCVWKRFLTFNETSFPDGGSDNKKIQLKSSSGIFSIIPKEY